MTTSCSSYYDIDAILAEEELVPVNNVLDFSHLAHLDPDYVHQSSASIVQNNNLSSQKSYSSIDGHEHGHDGSSSSSSTGGIGSIQKTKQQQQQQQHVLPENTRFKMPLWAIEKWSKLNYVRISLPKHYNRKGREKLDADPASVDLRRKSERFFLSGMTLINLIHSCVQDFHQNNPSASSSRRSRSNNPELVFMNNLHKESQELKRTLLLTYTGERLRRTFDWTMSHIDDDVSSFTKNLTVMEERLFQCSAAASHAFTMWKLYGSRRICVSETALRAGALNVNVKGKNATAGPGNTTPGTTSKRSLSSSSRMVSPDNDRGGGGLNGLNLSRKRMRSY